MLQDLYMLLLICPFVFLAGFVDAVGGGGGFISLPAYIMTGMPLHMALGTNKLSAMMGTLVTTLRYAKLGYIRLKIVILCLPFAFLGSSLGSYLALIIPDRAFLIFMLFLLPLTALYMLRQRRIGAMQQNEIFNFKVILRCALIAFVIGIYDGLYGPGTGTFFILGFCFFANFSIKNANGITKAMNSVTNVSSFVVFFYHDSIYVTIGLIAGIFGILGNYAGSVFFEKYGNVATKKIILIVITIFEIKVIYDLFFA
jgi:hypothetical protein